MFVTVDLRRESSFQGGRDGQFETRRGLRDGASTTQTWEQRKYQ
jgi:hypothetical protein